MQSSGGNNFGKSPFRRELTPEKTNPIKMTGFVSGLGPRKGAFFMDDSNGWDATDGSFDV